MDSIIKVEPEVNDVNSLSNNKVDVGFAAEPEPEIKSDGVEALSNNKVDVDIEPDVKANKTNLCSFSVVFNCFSFNRPK
jgi:hypothetical protein